MAKKSAREQAIDRIISDLEKKHGEIRRKIQNNKYQFKRLVEEQTVLKREAAETSQLIRDLRKKGKI